MGQDWDKHGHFLPGNSLAKTARLGPTVRYAKRIREATKDGEMLLTFLLNMLAGRAIEVPNEVSRVNGEIVELETPEGEIRLVWPTLEDQRWAMQQLQERGFGKSPERVEIAVEQQTPLLDPSKMTEQQLTAYAAFLEALSAGDNASQIVEGELVQGNSQATELVKVP